MRETIFPRTRKLASIPRTDEPAGPKNEGPATVRVQRVCGLCRRNRRGAAAVEFAIVAPVFFLLIFGMIEFGRMVMVQQIITNASREGARVAVLDGATATEVENRVMTYLESARIDTDGMDPPDIEPDDPASAGYGEPVSVEISIPFSDVSWLPAPFFIGGDTNLTATTVMRRETVQ